MEKGISDKCISVGVKIAESVLRMIAIYDRRSVVVKNQIKSKLLMDAQAAQGNGQYDVAVVKYNKYLENDPYNEFALNNLSVIYINQAKLELAEKTIMQCLQNSEGSADSFNHLAIVYLRTSRLVQASKLLEHALTLDPFKIETYLNLANVYGNLNDTAKSLHYALEGIKIAPTSSLAFNNLGSVLNSMAMFDEAVIAFETSFELDNNNIEALVNLGTISVLSGKNDEAISIYENALKKLPNKVKSQADVIKFLLSFEYLKKGILSKGWEYYDAGFHPNIPSANARAQSRTFKKPLWKGQPIKGSTLLIWREQGLGDEMLFLSCLPDLIKFHDKIILEVDKRLVETMQRSFPTITVRAQNYGPPPYFEAIYHDYDYHLPLGSLMRYFRKTIDDFKTSGPYVQIDPVKKNKFSDRLTKYKGKLLIGICWRSGNIDALRALTYVGIMKWGELFSMKDVVWVNLQYGECEDECLEAEKQFGIEIVRWPDLNLKDDLDDVFALMSQLDYVVTVATAVHHMSASTGVETLLVTPGGAWNRFHLDHDPWFSNLHPFIVNYQNLADALPLVKKHILTYANKT
jgi:tetratricopeptide (TPR) repeat protein